MAQVDIGGAIGPAFALIRRRPLVVVAWSGIIMLFVAVVLALLLPAFISIAALMAHRPEGPPDPGRLIGAMAQIQGLGLLVQVAAVALQAVLTAAVFRAVLFPQQDAWAYLRFGMAELYLGLLMLGERFALGFAMVFLALPFILIATAMGLSHAIIGAVIVGVLGVFVILAVTVWLALRFSLAGPMIVADNAFRLIESWRLTKGHSGSLLALSLLLVVILLALELVLCGVAGGLVVTALNAAPGGLAGLRTLNADSIGPLLATLTPVLVIVGLLWALFVGFVLTLFNAPWAAVYRQLAPTPAPAA